jgi:hypothetical protein
MSPESVRCELSYKVMDPAEEFLKHWDTRARWEPHTSECIPLQYSIAARCLEPRPKHSAEVVDLIPV